VRGGFDWGLTFKWKSLPSSGRGSPIDPIPSPTMAGGLFAMHKQTFIDLGKYDLVGLHTVLLQLPHLSPANVHHRPA
jgi:hypothetical protein